MATVSARYLAFRGIQSEGISGKFARLFIEGVYKKVDAWTVHPRWFPRSEFEDDWGGNRAASGNGMEKW
jgi:hypothetical protein